MHRAPVTRKNLAYLEVESIQDGPLIPATKQHPALPSWKIRGRVSDLRIVDPERWCTFLSPDRNCLTGDWQADPGEDGTAEFRTCDPPGSLSPGSRMTFAGQLYGKTAILVEDGPSAWEGQIFASRPAIATHFVDSEGRHWRKLQPFKEREALEPDAELVADGWDHEHCAICNEHIDPGDRYFQHKVESEYLCVTCFDKYVPTGDLSFLAPMDSESSSTDDR